MTSMALKIFLIPGGGAVAIAVSNSYPSTPISALQNSVHDQGKGGSLHLNFGVIVIIVLLAVAFVLSGCLHLIARCFSRRQDADTESVMTMGSMHGPLQHLFHLHDSGVDQTIIDSLPVFTYRSIIKGVEETNDCAVCLCEFQPDDKLRLLPACSHAFHLECIDTWLFCHSSCPLCRRSIISDGIYTPLALGISGDSYRSGSEPADNLHILTEREDNIPPTDSLGVSNLTTCHGLEDSFRRDGTSSQYNAVRRGSWEQRGNGFPEGASPQGSQIQIPFGSHNKPSNERFGGKAIADNATGRLVSVQLGKFRVGAGEATTRARGNVDARIRSYSMGSYEYVLNSDNLQVILSPTPIPGREQARLCHRPALSECIPNFKHDEIKVLEESSWANNFSVTIPKMGNVSRELDIPVGEPSWVNVNLDEKQLPVSTTSPDAKEVSSDVLAFLDTMKERLLGRKWPLSAPKSPLSDTSSSRNRTFSLRVPIPECKKLYKASQTRRSLSETTGLDAVMCMSVPSTGINSSHRQGQSSEGEGIGKLPSFRRWALQWLRS
eukprot:c9107_g1_i1 orf=649-2298(+)